MTDQTQAAGDPINPPPAAPAPAVPQGAIVGYRVSHPTEPDLGTWLVEEAPTDPTDLLVEPLVLAATPAPAPAQASSDCLHIIQDGRCMDCGASAQEPSDMTLRDYAEALIEAGHDFWKACRHDAGGGAVRWLSCDDGTLIVFTRGEYRDAVMGAVGGYRATEVVFEHPGSDEQNNGMVACSAPAQEVGLTEAERMRCLIASGCIGTVKMTYDSGRYEITRTSINASRLIDAIIAALRAKGGKL